MAYNYGNLAVKPKRREQEDYIIRETKKKVITRKAIPVKEKLLYLMTVLMLAVIASVIIFRYADIYHVNLQIKDVNKEIQSMQLEVEQLQREVQTLSNPERIRKLAEQQGMTSSLEPGIIVKKAASTNATALLE